MGIHKIEYGAYGVLRHNGVGIEQQHVLATALSDGCVVGTRKAEVVAAVHNRDMRKTRTYELYGAVVRIIVDYKHLSVYITQRAEERHKALLYIGAYLIANYYNRQFHHFSTVFQSLHRPACRRQYECRHLSPPRSVPW